MCCSLDLYEDQSSTVSESSSDENNEYCSGQAAFSFDEETDSLRSNSTLLLNEYTSDEPDMGSNRINQYDGNKRSAVRRSYVPFKVDLNEELPKTDFSTEFKLKPKKFNENVELTDISTEFNSEQKKAILKQLADLGN